MDSIILFSLSYNFIFLTDDEPYRKKTKEELRDLWQKAINQTLLLVRMERENARLRGEI